VRSEQAIEAKATFALFFKDLHFPTHPKQKGEKTPLRP
jgi:hypothetical protein